MARLPKTEDECAEYGDRTEKCPECDGSGVDPWEDHACMVCDGWGKVRRDGGA